MRRRRRADRFSVRLRAHLLEEMSTMRGAWAETPEEIVAGLAWGRRKAALLRWVRMQMERRLSEQERCCLELYYFEGLSFSQVAKETGASASTACRAVNRAIVKLRRAAAEEPPFTEGG